MPSSRSVYVPPGYPRDLHVKNYREPKVSTPEQAHDLRGLKNGWYVPIDEAKLRPFLLHMFNFNTKEYLKHLLPILLTKELIQTTPETLDKNLVFELQMVQKRGRDHTADCLERQVTFNPKKCTELNLWKQPDNEDWPEEFDPTAPVEAELLEYILVNALGEAEMQRLKQLASQPKPRKRKTTDTEIEIGSQTSVQSTDDTGKSAPKKQKKDVASGVDTTSSTSSPSTASKPAGKRKPTKRHGKTIESNKEAEPTEPEAAIAPVKKGFQLPRALVRNPSMLSEIASRSSQEVLSRSASYQSFDSTADTSRRLSDVLVSQYTSRYTSRASIEQTSVQALDSQVSPSSQLDWEAGSWLSPQPQLTTFHERTLSPRPSAIPAPSSSNINPPIQPTISQKPSSSRSQVVIDLGSDDEVTPSASVSSSATHARAPVPSTPAVHTPVSSSATTFHAKEPSAPSPPPLDSRQAIAAARLKHFEKKVPETVDLTLDD